MIFASIRYEIKLCKEGNVSFNESLNTFYLWLYGVKHIVKDHSVREETFHHHSFRLVAMVLLHVPSHTDRMALTLVVKH